ncbi:hypothetical protein MRX96_016255 [Rhipicephalus microplus]
MVHAHRGLVDCLVPAAERAEGHSIGLNSRACWLRLRFENPLVVSALGVNAPLQGRTWLCSNAPTSSVVWRRFITAGKVVKMIVAPCITVGEMVSVARPRRESACLRFIVIYASWFNFGFIAQRRDLKGRACRERPRSDACLGGSGQLARFRLDESPS